MASGSTSTTIQNRRQGKVRPLDAPGGRNPEDRTGERHRDGQPNGVPEERGRQMAEERAAGARASRPGLPASDEKGERQQDEARDREAHPEEPDRREPAADRAVGRDLCRHRSPRSVTVR